MIAALLAVLKAGGAFVPLDPSSPPERLRVLLEDIRPRALLTHRGLADRLPPIPFAMLDLDDEETCEGELGACVRPDDLAYVLYTSGSSGRPRGVMVEHRAICNTVLWKRQALELGPRDRVLLNLPYFFDASLTVIFPALAAGAELVLALPGEERDPQTLFDRMMKDGVTVLTLLPRLLGLLLDGPSARELSNAPLGLLRG